MIFSGPNEGIIVALGSRDKVTVFGPSGRGNAANAAANRSASLVRSEMRKRFTRTPEYISSQLNFISFSRSFAVELVSSFRGP